MRPVTFGGFIPKVCDNCWRMGEKTVLSLFWVEIVEQSGKTISRQEQEGETKSGKLWYLSLYLMALL